MYFNFLLIISPLIFEIPLSKQGERLELLIVTLLKKLDKKYYF